MVASLFAQVPQVVLVKLLNTETEAEGCTYFGVLMLRH